MARLAAKICCRALALLALLTPAIAVKTTNNMQSFSSGGGNSAFHAQRPPSYCPATRFTRQPAYEAARLIPQHSHSGCRGEYLPVSSQLTSQVVVLHRP